MTGRIWMRDLTLMHHRSEENRWRFLVPMGVLWRDAATLLATRLSLNSTQPSVKSHRRSPDFFFLFLTWWSVEAKRNEDHRHTFLHTHVSGVQVLLGKEELSWHVSRLFWSKKVDFKEFYSSWGFDSSLYLNKCVHVCVYTFRLQEDPSDLSVHRQHVPQVFGAEPWRNVTQVNYTWDALPALTGSCGFLLFWSLIVSGCFVLIQSRALSLLFRHHLTTQKQTRVRNSPVRSLQRTWSSFTPETTYHRF